MFGSLSSVYHHTGLAEEGVVRLFFSLQRELLTRVLKYSLAKYYILRVSAYYRCRQKVKLRKFLRDRSYNLKNSVKGEARGMCI